MGYPKSDGQLSGREKARICKEIIVMGLESN